MANVWPETSNMSLYLKLKSFKNIAASIGLDLDTAFYHSSSQACRLYNKGYPSETHLNLRSCEISLICNTCFNCPKILKFCIAQSMAVILPCSVQNWKVIWQLWDMLWANKTSQDLILICVSDGYSILHKASWILKQGKSEGFDSCDRPNNLTQIGFKSSIFGLCNLELWWMTSKNNRTPLLYHVKLCASFQSHWWIQTGVVVRKCSIWVKIGDFLSCVCDLEIWRMNLKNHTAPLLCYVKLCTSFHNHLWNQTVVTVQKLCHFKLCTSFHSHLWNQTGVQSRNAQFRSKSTIFLAVSPWNMTDDLQKQ